MQAQQRYTFSWDLLGDISAGRPHLGLLARVEPYRLLYFSLRDVIERRFGTEQADVVFQEAGRLAGRGFYAHYIGHAPEFHILVQKVQQVFHELGMGILRVEQADTESGTYIMTVAEDLDCSGLPELDFQTCKYMEGFLAGLLESFSGLKYEVTEVDCWCTGDRTCRFLAKVVDQHGGRV